MALHKGRGPRVDNSLSISVREGVTGYLRGYEQGSWLIVWIRCRQGENHRCRARTKEPRPVVPQDVFI